jgi:GTP-binding protein
MDAVLGYLPDRTATETKTTEVEDHDEGDEEWSPL